VTAPIKETKNGWFTKTRVEILPLTARVSKLDIWERFVLDLGNDNIALQAHNGKYVCAEGGGGQHLIANRDQIGPWKTFVLLKSYISVSGDLCLHHEIIGKVDRLGSLVSKHELLRGR